MKGIDAETRGRGEWLAADDVADVTDGLLGKSEDLRKKRISVIASGSEAISKVEDLGKKSISVIASDSEAISNCFFPFSDVSPKFVGGEIL